MALRGGVKLGPLPGSLTSPVAATIDNGRLYLLDRDENSLLVLR